MADPETIQRVAKILKRNKVDLLAGGPPPCQPFSRAGRSMIRHRVMTGAADPHDERRDLWRSFLEVVQLARPRAVMMENVPDMALDREMFILRSMTEELEQLGYSVSARVIESWRYGAPQMRQRLLFVALRDGLAFSWPQESEKRVTLWNAIGDMPEVEGGDGGRMVERSDGRTTPARVPSTRRGCGGECPRKIPRSCSTTSPGRFARMTGLPSSR